MFFFNDRNKLVQWSIFWKSRCFFSTLQLIIEFSKALKQLFLNSVTGTHGVTWAPSSGRQRYVIRRVLFFFFFFAAFVWMYKNINSLQVCLMQKLRMSVILDKTSSLRWIQLNAYVRLKQLNTATTINSFHATTWAHLYDLLAVLGGVHGRLRQQDLAVAGVNVELLWAEGVVP